jgi:hypothetical protein
VEPVTATHALVSLQWSGPGGFQNTQKSHFEWAPEYRLTATTRLGAAVGQEPTLHTDNTQIYLITGGSGTVLVEAEVAPDTGTSDMATLEFLQYTIIHINTRQTIP